jgi:hypothetical protein
VENLRHSITLHSPEIGKKKLSLQINLEGSEYFFLFSKIEKYYCKTS